METRLGRTYRMAAVAPGLLAFCGITMILTQVGPCGVDVASLVQEEVSKEVPPVVDAEFEARKSSFQGDNCWDINGNGIEDQAEDVNGDGRWDSLDCQGEEGDPGDSGSDGEKGDTGQKGDKGDKGDPGSNGANGADGDKGDKGDKGDEPKHEWIATSLRFENPDGTWGASVDLKGEKGEEGDPGTGNGDITAVRTLGPSGLDGGKESEDVELSIASGGVTNARLAIDAVTQDKIADNAVGSPEIINESITASDLGPDSVNSSEISPGAVGNSELSNGAVTDAKVSDVGWSKITGKPTSFPPTGPAGGDLDGTYPNPTVDGLQGRAVSPTAPASGQVLEWDGSAWAPGTDDAGGSQWQNDTSGIHYTYNVGIGVYSSSPDYKLDVEGDLRVKGDATITGDVVLGSGSSDPVRIETNLSVDGHLTFDYLSSASGTTVVVGTNGRLYKESSSLRYQHNVTDLPLAGDAVLQLRPVTFAWDSTGEPDIGLIAEEVAEVLPDLVICDADGRPEAVKYDRLAVYLLEVIKAQREQIASQEQRLDRLERELGELKAQIVAHQ